MQVRPIKIFLNQEIRGDEVRAKEQRLFCGAAKIKPPRYDSRYLEAFPTIWAAAYEFRQLIKLSVDKNAEESILKAANEAVEEWVCLFLLHYSGVINPYVYTNNDDDEKNDFGHYDRDLWTALSLTFPGGELSSITLLRADDATQLGAGTVVGACYPGVLIFPSRGRSSWLQSETLRPYLEGGRLSWQKCCDSQLLRDPQDRVEFSTHLASIEKRLGEYQNALKSFRLKEIQGGHLPVPNGSYDLSEHLDGWKRQVIEDAETLMDKYPLVRDSADGKRRTYYFVDEMPGTQEFWVSEPIGRGMPAPRNFSLEKGTSGSVMIKHAGKAIRHKLKTGADYTETVVRLKDCFLPVNPFWCAIPGGDFESRIRSFHRVSTKREGPFSSLKQGETAICLAPVNSLFLQSLCPKANVESPDGLLKKISVEVNRGESDDREGELDWSFELQGRDGAKTVHWSTKVEQRSDVSNNAVALWPPQTSDDWHFYVARCFGSSKSKSGTWILVDENGKYDTTHKAFALDVTLEEGKTDVTEYVSHIPLAATPTDPNKPKYLMLLDTDEAVERGILFLDDSVRGTQEKEHAPSATLAVDFGTSNTCMAVGSDNRRETLVFSLSPTMVWGRRPVNELPGRTPFKWQGKQFYPTIFMSRKKSGVEQVQPHQLAVGNLFQVDIPSLHGGIEDKLFLGKFDDWNVETNLKWRLKVEHNAYRQLFLALSLVYAHAEIFFRGPRGIQIKDYVFSFPLAFTSTEENQYCHDAKAVAQAVRHLCYGEIGGGYHKVDESTAIALDSGVAADDSIVQVFIDVGGGTTDIAIRKGEEFPARDSIRVAGRTFFAFAEENFKRELKGSKDFKINISRLLVKEDKEFPLDSSRLDLGTLYSLAVSRLDEADFRSREAVVLQNGMGSKSYQRYRSLLFFRQIIAYGLLQALAAAITNSSQTEIRTLEMVLAGNAWGLMLFAELKRRSSELKSEVEGMFRFLKRVLGNIMEKEDESPERAERLRRLSLVESVSVRLLNEVELSKAKTAVALGAVKARAENRDRDISEADDHERKATAYAGLTLKSSKVNERALSIAWYDKWDIDHIKMRMKNEHSEEMIGIKSFAAGNHNNTKEPFDELLKVFLQFGNVASYEDDVPLPPETWQTLNALLHQDRIYYRSDKELGTSPISYFIADLLYPDGSEHEYLKDLARINKTL